MLTSRQIRQDFIDFFVEKHGHTFVPSSPVVPHDDPTLLFANAGMNQFKPYFLATQTPPYLRAANTQKCIRAGGKHNDLEDVGRSRRHHTFFEMLGNWSFGDYFKQGAIEMAWELLTEVWKMDPSRLHVTVYQGDPEAGVPRDDEAVAIWKAVAKLPDDHIHYCGKDNFWEMGETGPCGPCTEIFIDRTPDKSGGKDVVSGDNPLVIEFWNNVFIQYNRDSAGKLTPLPAQHVDTGMGFERIAQILQGKSDNYAIDLWEPFFEAIAQMSGKRYTGAFPDGKTAAQEDAQLRTDVAFRVIADHVRCLTFAITDGATPGNEGRNYVLRRILRRAVRFGRQQLELHEPFLHRLAPVVVDAMGEAFPELKKNPKRVVDLILDEEQSFNRTIDRGIALFEDACGLANDNTIDAESAFKLHDTYGFPLDLTQVMAQERGMEVDVAGFNRRMKQAQEQSRAGAGQGADLRDKLIDVVQKGGLPATMFTGYDQTQGQATIAAVLHEGNDGQLVGDGGGAPGNTAFLVADQTPFYAEAGGQVGDRGAITADNGTRFIVTDTFKIGDVYFHQGSIEGDGGAMKAGQRISLQVDQERRGRIMANHTTTHVLNRALRSHVNTQADQRGSLVDDEKLRFDFSHNASVTPLELNQVEAQVNADIQADLPVHCAVPAQEEALRISGLRAVFGEKYPPRVRVVSIGQPVEQLLAKPDNEVWRDLSIEFCGGTHLPSTGLAQHFAIVSEEAVGKGVRRLTAITGERAKKARSIGQELLKRVADLRGAPADQLSDQIAAITDAMNQATLPATVRLQLREGLGELMKIVKDADKQRSKEAAGAVVEDARKLAEENDGPVIVGELPGADADGLRTAMDVIRKKRPESALLLAGASAPDKVAIVAAVPPEMIKKGLKAGDWVREVAKITGGGGGGRPDMAQAGGKDASKLAQALDAARSFAAGKLQ